MEKIRNTVLEKIKIINQEIKESWYLDNINTIKELYKQRRKLVYIYQKYKTLDKNKNL